MIWTLPASTLFINPLFRLFPMIHRFRRGALAAVLPALAALPAAGAAQGQPSQENPVFFAESQWVAVESPPLEPGREIPAILDGQWSVVLSSAERRGRYRFAWVRMVFSRPLPIMDRMIHRGQFDCESKQWAPVETIVALGTTEEGRETNRPVWEDAKPNTGERNILDLVCAADLRAPVSIPERRWLPIVPGAPDGVRRDMDQYHAERDGARRVVWSRARYAQPRGAGATRHDTEYRRHQVDCEGRRMRADSVVRALSGRWVSASRATGAWTPVAMYTPDGELFQWSCWAKPGEPRPSASVLPRPMARYRMPAVEHPGITPAERDSLEVWRRELAAAIDTSSSPYNRASAVRWLSFQLRQLRRYQHAEVAAHARALFELDFLSGLQAAWRSDVDNRKLLEEVTPERFRACVAEYVKWWDEARLPPTMAPEPVCTVR
jgi:hypothetical protein